MTEEEKDRRKKKKEGETWNKIPTVGNGGGSLSLEIRKKKKSETFSVDYPVGILTTILLYIRAIEPKTTKLHWVSVCRAIALWYQRVRPKKKKKKRKKRIRANK